MRPDGCTIHAYGARRSNAALHVGRATGTTGTAGQIPLTLAGTARVQGNVVDQALDGTGFDGKAISERTRETIATTGTSVTYTMTCPASKTRSGTYSATSTSMTLFLVNDLGQTVGYTYTR